MIRSFLCGNHILELISESFGRFLLESGIFLLKEVKNVIFEAKSVTNLPNMANFGSRRLVLLVAAHVCRQGEPIEPISAEALPNLCMRGFKHWGGLGRATSAPLPRHFRAVGLWVLLRGLVLLPSVDN